MSVKKTLSILLIGFDSNLCLGVAFCLKNAKFNVYLLTHNKCNAGRFSNFIDKTFYYDGKAEDVKTIAELSKRLKIDVIMPFDEMEIRKVNINKKELLSLGYVMPTTDTEFFDIGINKKLLSQYIDHKGIRSLKFREIKNVSELIESAHEIGFPLLLKPTRSSFGRGIQRFNNLDSLLKHTEKIDFTKQDFLIQPYIVGSDISVNVICKNGQILCHTLQETAIKEKGPFVSGDSFIFHDDPDVLEYVTAIIKELNWNGVACIDLRRNIADKKVYILEINGRFWASMISSFMKANINFPYNMIKLAMEGNIPEIYQTNSKQISLKEYCISKITGKNTSFKETKYISYFADPMARIMQIVEIFIPNKFKF